MISNYSINSFKLFGKNSLLKSNLSLN